METISLQRKEKSKSEHAVETVLREYILHNDRQDGPRGTAKDMHASPQYASSRTTESQDEFFNFEELESFLLHVVERKPGIFRLLSRTIQRAGRLRSSEDWTLDADLRLRATHGESDLFVLASPEVLGSPFESTLSQSKGNLKLK